MRIFYTALLLRPFKLVLLAAVTTWFIDKTTGRMAHLPQAEIIARRNAASQDIIAEWQQHQGQEWYAIQCPCRIDCGCIPELEVPRLVLSNCMYPGELDYFLKPSPFRLLMILKSDGTVMSAFQNWPVGSPTCEVVAHHGYSNNKTIKKNIP